MAHPNPIKIYSIVSKGCIFFDNSTVSPKFLGTVEAAIHPVLADRIVVSRLDRVRQDGVTPRTLFRRLNPDRVQNQAGVFLTDIGFSVQDVIDYINGESNKSDVVTSGSVFPQSETLDFTRDETNTSVLFSNGDHHGINALKAVAKDNGKLGIFTIRGDVELYELDHDKATIEGSAPVSTTIEGVVNDLNAFFTLSALSGSVTAAPVYTQQDGVNLAWNESMTHNPTGDGLYGKPTTGTAYHGARVWTTETINEPGEYFTFEVRNMVAGGGPLLGIGLWSEGDGDLAEVQDDSLSNSGHHGYWFSTWLYNYSGYSAPWTTYGSNSNLSYGPGWSYYGNDKMFRYSDANLAFRDGGNALFKCGITDDGFVGVWYYDVEVEGRDGGYGARSNEWILIARSGTPVPEGEFGLMVKIPTTSAQIMTSPKRFASDPAAPTLYYRYIESPDGQYHYPLFASAEEANWVDEQNGGTGTSHTHVYPDDPTNTIWYMPDNGNTMPMHSPTPPLNTAEITYTEIPTLADGGFGPAAFSGSNITVSEGDTLNIQTQPADTYYITTISGAPAGVVVTSDGRIVGSAPEVTGDNVTNPSDEYTITVYRTNDYGTSTGTFLLTVNNLTPPVTVPNGFTLEQGTLNPDGSLGSDSVVSIDGGLEVGKRYVVPVSWTNLNVLPFVDGALDKAFFGVPKTTANWSDVDLHEDFDAVMRWEWVSNSSHKSSVSTGDSSNANHNTVSSMTNAYWNYAIEWDGTDLRVFRSSSLSDLQSKHSSELTSVSYVYAGYTAQSGTLPLVFATKTGGSMAISTSGMQVIDIPAAPLVGGQTDVGIPYTPSYTFSIGSTHSAREYYYAGDDAYDIYGIDDIGMSGSFLEVNFKDSASMYAFRDGGTTVSISSDDGTDPAWEFVDADVASNVYTTSAAYNYLLIQLHSAAGGSSNWNDMVAYVASGEDTNLVDIEFSTPVAPILTPWTKALDFSGSSERAMQVTTSSSWNALRMRGYAVSVGMPTDLSKTSGSGTSCPWATAVVFKSDGNNSNQHIWNQGEGSGNTDDNIYLRIDADDHLRFGWGRNGSLNEIKIAHNIDVSKWHAVYIAHNGYRSNVPSEQNLADAFDIYMMSSADNFDAISANLSVPSAGQSNGLGWSSTGRMDRKVEGDFTVGGRGANRNFHGKVAAMNVVTLEQNKTMPDTDEVKMLLTDPVRWVQDYRAGGTFRMAGASTSGTWNGVSQFYHGTGVQMWLMGDTSTDSYSNMIRNYVYPSDQNYTKLNMISMVSNDIQTVNIPGLS